MPPRTIADRYVVERAVGEGRYGHRVAVSRRASSTASVAVKEVGNMPASFDLRPGAARCARRASVAALNHPNVVSSTTRSKMGDHIWLIMEYVPSKNLSAVVAEEGAALPRAGRLDRRAGR